jgi:hypothetical protein
MDGGCSARWMGRICSRNICANTVFTIPDRARYRWSPLTLATTWSWENIYRRSCEEHESLSLRDWSPFRRCFVYDKSKVKLVDSRNHTEHYGNYIISHVQNTTALQPSVFLIGIRRLLVIRKGQLSPAQKETDKVNYKLLSQHQYQSNVSSEL